MNGPALDILVVEDDPVLREILRMHCNGEGWSVRCAADGDEALTLCEAQLPDVAILDVMLPMRSGLEVCAMLRARYHPSPGVIMVTARSSEADVLFGLEVGADDYVIKPCRPREVVARVHALARRLRPQEASPAREEPVPELVRGRLRINPVTHRVTVDREAVRLTLMEFQLLAFLAQRPDFVYSRAQLLQELWDSAHTGYERNVDCHVTRLRRKLEAAGLLPSPIETVHGVGYRFLRTDP